MQIQEALLPMLVAGVFGLLVGAGFVAGFVALMLHRRAAQKADKADAAAQGDGGRAGKGGQVSAASLSAKSATTQPSVPPQSPQLPYAADLLVVDDSAVARAKLRRLFEAAGYRIHLVNDGVEALAKLQQGRYGLMLTDLEMPNMDGIALINACLGQAQTATMPILAITGHERLRVKFNECHDICGIHRKPWVDDILLSHVAALVPAGQQH